MAARAYEASQQLPRSSDRFPSLSPPLTLYPMRPVQAAPAVRSKWPARWPVLVSSYCTRNLLGGGHCKTSHGIPYCANGHVRGYLQYKRPRLSRHNCRQQWRSPDDPWVCNGSRSAYLDYSRRAIDECRCSVDAERLLIANNRPSRSDDNSHNERHRRCDE